MQLRFVDHQSQAGIATRHRMADSVAFEPVEKQHLIRFGNGLILADMPDIDPTIREHQLRAFCALLRTLVSTGPSAVCISYGDSRRSQKRLNIELKRLFIVAVGIH
jgi:hypothetical protein